MKISLNWLTDYVDVSSIPAKELAKALHRIGVGVEAIEETESDVVLVLEITSNRPDWLGHIGVARELSAVLGLPLKLPDLSKIPTGAAKACDLTSVQVLDPDLCPRYTARVIRGVKVSPSPRWMVERLAAVGLRSVNNIVDVTNYVLMEYSQPLHSFDMDRLAEGRIVVRRARAGEQIVSIDGTTCPLTTDMLVIADAAKPVAIAGIMGGLESEIGPATVNVLLESAQFDPLTTRKTARKLMLMSDSSYRFERGVDPVGLDAASLRACQLILQTAGGELASGVADVWAKPYVPAQVSLRPARTKRVLGVDIPETRQQEILDRLGLAPRREGDRIVCTIPAFRADLTREIDLIEEVIRVHGLDAVPTYSSVTHSMVPLRPAEQARAVVRDALAGAGFDESITVSFIDDAEAALFGHAGGCRVDERVRKTNNLLRPTVLPSLLRACKNNQDMGNLDVSLYEISAVFPAKPGGGDLPDEHFELALVSQGDLRELRGAVEAVVEAVCPSAAVTLKIEDVTGLAGGASARLEIDGKICGMLGLVDRRVLDYYGLEKPHAAAALRLDAILDLAGRARTFKSLPKLPGIRRDVSLQVDESVSWEQLAAAVRAVGQPAMESIDYVGTYTGKQVPAGKKSVTLTIHYRLADQTLRREQADEMVAQVVQATGTRFGAVQR